MTLFTLFDSQAYLLIQFIIQTSSIQVLLMKTGL